MTTDNMAPWQLDGDECADQPPCTKQSVSDRRFQPRCDTYCRRDPQPNTDLGKEVISIPPLNTEALRKTCGTKPAAEPIDASRDHLHGNSCYTQVPTPRVKHVPVMISLQCSKCRGSCALRLRNMVTVGVHCACRWISTLLYGDVGAEMTTLERNAISDGDKRAKRSKDGLQEPHLSNASSGFARSYSSGFTSAS